jgi:dihydroorotate dehydrogenase electron transfer subunit
MTGAAPCAESSAEGRLARRELEVVANDRCGPYRLLRISDPEGAQPRPGQFAMMSSATRWGGGSDERPFLARALSYARFQSGEAHFLIADVGPGTHRLCELRPRERVELLGPLGRPFQRAADPRAEVLLVGGGIGIAPLVALADALQGKARALFGFRDGASAQAARICTEVAQLQIATDDGSAGIRGSAVDLLAQALAEPPQREPPEGARPVVAGCGPAPMLEALRGFCFARGVDCELSLEAPMACGYGACYGCVVELADGTYARSCIDGPVLEADRLAAIPDDRA